MKGYGLSDETSKEFKKKCVDLGVKMKDVLEGLAKKWLKGEIKYEIVYKK